MKIPQTPPPFSELIAGMHDSKKMLGILELRNSQPASNDYPHWDRLRRYRPPNGFTSADWWLAVKMERIGLLKHIPLQDKKGRQFQFCVPEILLEYLHRIDVKVGATFTAPDQITNPQTRDQYLIRSLMEEAITSSQLEGAATTREAAKEMIRTGRAPRDKDEQMILNNYVTMQRITSLKDYPLSPQMVFEIHRLVTEKTLDEPSAAGRFRTKDEKRVVGDYFGLETYHEPPPAEELVNRLRAMCDFANAQSPAFFIHPVVRAIILHFWLAYDHPFVDGNGRTARALFYWAMRRAGYWLFEFISISTILRKSPTKYGLSFLYTETDENDLTYFIVAQVKVIDEAIKSLHDYIDRKTSELRDLESQIRVLNCFNHRQVDIIRHALKHPYQQYTIESHKQSHNVVYETARTDLLNLHKRGVLEQKKRGQRMVFVVPKDLAGFLKKLGKKLGSDE
jgi:Fic family protein